MSEWAINFFQTTPFYWRLAFYIFGAITCGIFCLAPLVSSKPDEQASNVSIDASKSISRVNSPNSQQQFIDKYYAAPQTQPSSFERVKGSSTERVYFTKTPSELWQDVAKLTPAQSKTFIEREYVGKWTAFRAPILSLYESDDLGTVDFSNSSFKATLILMPEQVSKLKDLYRGATITVEGKFNSILDDFVSFDEGVIIEP